MKLIFSEEKPDYAHYNFPYAIWAIPEMHETPAMIFAQGFLPSSRELDRFYLCRQIRVNLNQFEPSSENRRILRKGANIEFRLIPRSDFAYTDQWREFCKTYADIRFGKNVMSYPRLDSLFHSKIISHILLFTDEEKQQDVGLATLYLEEKRLAYYYYAFYDLNYYARNLGMFMMTSAVNYFAQLGFDYLYLGTCYSHNALYKTQFSGFEFFNGFCWSTSLKELKYLLQRDKTAREEHLVETEAYRDLFYEGQLQNIVQMTAFTIQI